jgi:hypothetical protein
LANAAARSVVKIPGTLFLYMDRQVSARPIWCKRSGII